MKKVLSVLFSIILLTFGLSVFSACGADNSNDWNEIKEKGKFVVGCTIFKPITYQEGDEWKGFDVELAQAVGDVLDLDVEFQIIKWDNKIIELNSKSIDCIWNGMTISDELLNATSVSAAYMKNRQVVIVSKDNVEKYNTQEKLSEARLVAESGSAGAGFGAEVSSRFTPVATQLDIFTNIINNTADAGILDSVLAGYYLTESAYQNLTMVDVGFSEEEYGIAFRKGSPLKDKVNEALKQLWGDGTIQEIGEKYGLSESLIAIK